MRSSADSAPARILRGAHATSLPKAQVSIELRGSELMRKLTADARLFDPGLVAAFDEIAEAARQAAAQEGFSAGFQAGVEAAQADEAVARTAREAEFNSQLNGQLSALNGVTIALQQAALAGLNGGLAVALMSTAPVMALPLAWWFEGDRPGWRGLAAASAALAGISLVVGLPGPL
jgi:hypothetical protein